MPRYCAGIVNHRSHPDLLRCLESLTRQSARPEGVAVVDHDPEPEALEAARKRHPDVVWQAGPNRGFAAGANRALSLAASLCPGADFLLLLNADVQLDPRFAETVMREMDARPDVALGSGKLLRGDRRTLDSAGICMRRSRRTLDRGGGEPDRGQYERLERVFAVSGAALMIRSAARPALEVEGELFDEDFFAYREDTDLAWRARLLGWSALYVPAARAVHERGWRRDAARRIAPAIRAHSFKNRYLEMIKNERPAELLRDLPAILAWEAVRLAYALLWDRGRLPAYPAAWRLAARAFSKRRIIQRRVSA